MAAEDGSAAGGGREAVTFWLGWGGSPLMGGNWADARLARLAAPGCQNGSRGTGAGRGLGSGRPVRSGPGEAVQHVRLDADLGPGG